MSINDLTKLKEVIINDNKSLVLFNYNSGYIFNVKKGIADKNIGKVFFHKNTCLFDQTQQIFYFEADCSNAQFKLNEIQNICLDEGMEEKIYFFHPFNLHYDETCNGYISGIINSNYKLYFKKLECIDALQILDFEVIEEPDGDSYNYSFNLSFEENNNLSERTICKFKVDIFRDENKERKILTHVFDVLINFESEEPGGF